MESFRKTRTAAGYAARHASAALTRVRAAALLEQLADWETAADGDIRSQAAADPGLLRSLVIAVRDLAGTGWLDTMADDPDVAAFTALSATASAPPPHRIDETCSRLLWARFSPLGASQAADAVGVRPAGAGQRPRRTTADRLGRLGPVGPRSQFACEKSGPGQIPPPGSVRPA